MLHCGQKMGLPTFIAALDMQKAFDSADHRLIVTRLALKGADRPTCRLFGALMERHYSLIEQEGAAPARVAIERGVLQGFRWVHGRTDENASENRVRDQNTR